MKRLHFSLVCCWLFIHLAYAPSAWGQVDKSADREASEYLTPQQVADLTTFMMSMQTPLAADGSDTPAVAANLTSSSNGFAVDGGTTPTMACS